MISMMNDFVTHIQMSRTGGKIIEIRLPDSQDFETPS